MITVKQLKNMLQKLEEKGHGDEPLWAHEKGGVTDVLVTGINYQDKYDKVKVVISCSGTVLPPNIEFETLKKDLELFDNPVDKNGGLNPCYADTYYAASLVSKYDMSITDLRLKYKRMLGKDKEKKV